MRVLYDPKAPAAKAIIDQGRAGNLFLPLLPGVIGLLFAGLGALALQHFLSREPEDGLE